MALVLESVPPMWEAGMKFQAPVWFGPALPVADIWKVKQQTGEICFRRIIQPSSNPLPCLCFRSLPMTREHVVSDQHILQLQGPDCK